MSDKELLSAAEIEEIEAKVRADIAEQKKVGAKEAYEAKVRRELAYKEGLVTGNAVKDEIVTIMVDLAPHSSAIVINGIHYFHGSTHTIPRHIADTLAEVAFRGWRHQNEIDGKSMTDFFGQKRIAEMYDVKKGANIGHKINTRTGLVSKGS